MVLPVSGAFHSPLMAPAKAELEAAINSTTFNSPICPVYQNLVAATYTCNTNKRKPNSKTNWPSKMDAMCASNDS